MSMVSPTPMGSSHFAGPPARRPSSRQAYSRQPLSRPNLVRADPLPAIAHSRHYSLNDSSDDEIVLPMKFSAQTNALLNDGPSIVGSSPPKHVRTFSEPYKAINSRAGSEEPKQEPNSPPASREQSPPRPLTRRIVRLSGTPGSFGSSSLRRTSSLSSAVKRHNELQAAPKPESPLVDLSTPPPVPRTVRIAITNSGNQGPSGGSSGRNSQRAGSEARNEELESQEYPTTAARSHLANSQGSVSRFGQTTVGRSRYEETGLASSMRTRRVEGKFLSGPARRGRRRLEDEGQSPLDENVDGLNSAGASQEPASQESQARESEGQFSSQEQYSSQEPGSSFYPSFASGSPAGSRDNALRSILRSRSPPPPTSHSASSHSAVRDAKPKPVSPIAQPAYKIPPRPQIPSAHDQENEAPPTFRRNKQAPLIHLDKLEKAPIVRPASMDMDALRIASPPERRPLAPRSQNTPRRPAPPPPKMSILDAATSTAGAAATSQASGKRNRLKLNGKYFTRLDCIGRGGSSRVYRVMAENSKFFALKRVSLDDADESAVRGFKGEIDLLRKLEGVERVIRLYDFELNEEKGTLSVVSFI